MLAPLTGGSSAGGRTQSGLMVPRKNAVVGVVPGCPYSAKKQVEQWN